MNSTVNRAFRSFYFRALPLKVQPELVGSERAICDEIETQTRGLCEIHSDLIQDDRSSAHLFLSAIAFSSYR